MKVSDLRDRTPVDEIVLKITNVNEPRDTRVGQVQDAVVEDETGTATLTLWTDDVGRYGVGDTIRISNGWCKVYQGQVQVSAGKYGTIEKIKE
jgi:ssDNA-binding replication factor A large subunit